MPCDTVQTATVDIGKLDPTLAADALKALGMETLVSYSDGKLIQRGRYAGQDISAQFKVQYSHQVVQQTAKKMGWQLKPTGANKYEVIKR